MAKRSSTANSKEKTGASVAPPERIVFSKTDALGDQLWATGTVAALLERLPKTQVIWLVRSGYEAVHRLLLGSNVFRPVTTQSPSEEVKRFNTEIKMQSGASWERVVFVPIGLNAYGAHPSNRNLAEDVAWWAEFVRLLRADAAIAGTVTLNWVDRFLVGASQARLRIGYQDHFDTQPLPREIGVELQATAAFGGFTRELVAEAASHEAEFLACLVEPLTGRPGFPEIRLRLDFEPASISKIAGRVFLSPGAGDPQKVYPLKELADAVVELRDTSNVEDFWILQGPQDQEVCARLARELSRRGVTAKTVCADPLDPSHAAKLLCSASLLICNDSFWVHLASVVGTPTVAVWGLGHWARFVPKQGHVTVVHTEMLCQQCNWLCCFPVRHCIIDIPFGSIVKAARERLSEAGALQGVILQSVGSRIKRETVRQALYLQAKRADALVHERNLLESQLKDLQANFSAVEQDRAARGQLIEEQGRKLSALEVEFDARLKELRDLYATAEVIKNERNLLAAQFKDLQMNFAAVEQDRAARGQLIEEQGQKLSALEGQFDARLKELSQLYVAAEAVKNERNLLAAQLKDLQANFSVVEQDRAARGRLIEEQGQKLSSLEREFDGRLKELSQLYVAAEAIRNERNLLAAQLKDLQANFSAVEQDRAARGQLIEEQGRKLSALEGEFDARLRELSELYVAAEAIKNERNLLAAQLKDLQANFSAVEQDRVARGQLIEEQGRKRSALEGEFDARLKELKQLYANAEIVKNERNMLAAQLNDVQLNFRAVEADRVERGKLIEEQGQRLSALEGEFDARLKELKELYAVAETVKNQRNLLEAQLKDLQANFTAVEEDRAARGKLIDEQGQKMSQLEGEFDTRLKELERLYATAETVKNERNLLQARLQDLQANFTAVEKDRSDRGKVIDEQGRRLSALEGQFERPRLS